MFRPQQTVSLLVNYGLPLTDECIMPGLTIDNSFQDMDIAAFLRANPSQYDPIFSEAIHFLESMKSSPLCHRTATATLVTSCQSIGVKSGSAKEDNSAVVDHVKSLYAARLAICELDGAGASVPLPCLQVNEVPPEKRKGLFGFSSKTTSRANNLDCVPTELLESCLKSLESRPQWWTSYSNSRQNAVVICQAARIELEKEELLELHRSAVVNTYKLNQGLQEALRDAESDLSRHRAFMSMVDAVRTNLSHELGESESYVKRTASRLLNDIETAVGSVISGIVSTTGKATTEATALETVSVRRIFCCSKVLRFLGNSESLHRVRRSTLHSSYGSCRDTCTK